MLAATTGTLFSHAGRAPCTVSLDAEAWRVSAGGRCLRRAAVFEGAAPAHVFAAPPSAEGKPLATRLEILLFSPALVLEERDGRFWPLDDAATKALLLGEQTARCRQAEAAPRAESEAASSTSETSDEEPLPAEDCASESGSE